MQQEEKKTNGQMLQGVIGDNLFPEVQHISDVKQVLELQRLHGQALREEQIRALILLEELGNNKQLHGDKNPYAGIIKSINDTYKQAVVNPAYYLDTIEELIPKPPKPIILTERGGQARVVNNSGGRG